MPCRCNASAAAAIAAAFVAGRAALEAMLRCFTQRLAVFAVGKVAQEALERWRGMECTGYIRHPAQGGESLFRAQFRSQVASRL